MQRLLVTTAAMAVLSGCSWFGDGSSTDYKSASTLPPLEVPPDLTSPQRDNRYQIPDTATRPTATFSGYEAERRDPARAARAAGAAPVVLPEVDRMRIERSKYRTRLERTADGKGTEIYISHRGMQEIYTTARDPSTSTPGNTAWQPR